MLQKYFGSKEMFGPRTIDVFRLNFVQMFTRCILYRLQSVSQPPFLFYVSQNESFANIIVA